MKPESRRLSTVTPRKHGGKYYVNDPCEQTRLRVGYSPAIESRDLPSAMFINPARHGLHSARWRDGRTPASVIAADS